MTMNKLIIAMLGGLLAVLSIAFFVARPSGTVEPTSMTNADTPIQPIIVPDTASVATFAGGCFWCTEAAFQEREGVYDAVSGYVGGEEVDPTYEDVYKLSLIHI